MSDATNPPPPTPPAPRPLTKNTYGWIVFFVFILVASFGAAAFMIWYNRSIQLRPELLQAAKQLWKEKGLRDYKLVYTTRIDDASTTDRFVVTVRDGKAQEVFLNGRPLTPEEGHDPRPYRSMDRLFNDIERNMEMDSRPDQPKVYVTAVFDGTTGALRHYVRRVMGSSKRMEINVESLEPLGKWVVDP